jgi:hypothetical protein
MILARTLNSEGLKSLGGAELDDLRARLRGDVFVDGDAEYDDARSIWNAMVDRKPALVIRAMGASDVRQAVNFVRNNGLLMSVRSGGHQIAGHAVADNAVMLDLSTMRSVHIDSRNRIARVEPGALLGDIDTEAQVHALAVPVGVNSITGIAGLTLGGGFGWLTRKHGMTIDNLLSADVVLADGSIVHTSASELPDLFWAIRGGGGNFGVVTSFEFRLHDVGPDILGGLIVHPLEQALEILPEFDAVMKAAPDELTVWAVLRKSTPLEFLPVELRNKPSLIFSVCYAGDFGEGEKVIGRLRALGRPLADTVKPTPFTEWQKTFDAGLIPGFRNYWKSQDLQDLSPEVIAALLGAVAEAPEEDCEVFLAQVGGAMARVPNSATAYPQRDAHFIMNVHARWTDRDLDGVCIGWARKAIDDLSGFAIGSLYVNFMPEDDVARVTGAYGENLGRLRQLKLKYDPGNLFRLNHNIEPAKNARREDH